MKNFDWTKFTRKIVIQSSLQKLYEAWATPSGIEKWFLKSANYFDSANNKVTNRNSSVENNFTYEWNWFLYDLTEKGKIIRANGKDFFQFSFAGECTVEVILTEKGEFVLVELTQKNIPTDDESKQHIRLGCDTGWAFYLVNLKSVLEGGLDLRNKNPEFKAMINS